MPYKGPCIYLLCSSFCAEPGLVHAHVCELGMASEISDDGYHANINVQKLVAHLSVIKNSHICGDVLHTITSLYQVYSNPCCIMPLSQVTMETERQWKVLEMVGIVPISVCKKLVCLLSFFHDDPIRWCRKVTFWPQIIAVCVYRLKETTLYLLQSGHICKYFFLIPNRNTDYCIIRRQHVDHKEKKKKEKQAGDASHSI